MEERNIQNQRTGLIVVSALLALSLIGNVILLVRNSRLSNERDQALAQVEVTATQWEQQGRELQQLQDELQTLRTQRAELETDLTAELEDRDTRVAQLNRRIRTLEGNVQNLRQENENLHQALNNIEADYQTARNELEWTRTQLQDREATGEAMADSIARARPLRAYNIFPLTYWDRWIFADQYNVTRARRVDETHVSFEVAGTVFSPQGPRDVYLVMIDPEGQVMNNQGQVFEIQETGEQMAYTRQQQINFSDDPISVNFVVEHDQRLQPGDYQLQVYIDGRLSRTSTMTLE
jgi:DNA gyrase/topoisomerase IV subunit A